MKKEDQNVENLKKLAALLDSRFHGPFNTRFGLDPILGLIPGVGDFVTSAMSVYIIAQALSLGVGSSTLTRMAINLLIDNLIDVVPFLGNIFDFYWKANNKNIALLEAHLANPARETIKSRMVVALFVVLIACILFLSCYVTWTVFSAIFHWVTAYTD